jgi:hypothetical protein
MGKCLLLSPDKRVEIPIHYELQLPPPEASTPPQPRLTVSVSKIDKLRRDIDAIVAEIEGDAT